MTIDQSLNSPDLRHTTMPTPMVPLVSLAIPHIVINDRKYVTTFQFLHLPPKQSKQFLTLQHFDVPHFPMGNDRWGKGEERMGRI